MFDFFISQTWFFAALALYAAGALGALAFKKYDAIANWVGNSLAVIGSGLAFVFSAAVLTSGQTLSFLVPTSFPGFNLSFNVDRLSAFFILIISLLAFVCSVYAIGYVKHYYGKHDVGSLGFFYNFFIAGMLMVVSANNALFFLVAWEIMSLTSYFLVIYERRDDNIKAGTLYFIMTHVGTAFILFAFMLLYKSTGSFEFGAMKTGAFAITPLIKDVIFLSALIGFGTKAGIIPLHIWLPSAHPAAPSHVSALMSGVMIKTGIYMFVRIFFDILPNAPLWWGLVILVAGAVSSLLGVLYALAEHDIKRLLAYHSIENIGIILLGLGSSLVFLALGYPLLAIIGLVAALFHTLNHAVFKALLFLGAGSIISGTHTRNIEEYGGLMKRMPQTALFFLVGSMAISALPPLNGFFSEWLTFQSLFNGVASFASGTKIIFILSAGALALTGGLAAACFVKAFGAAFLARPRSEDAKHAKESSASLLFGMGVLALLTLVIGFSAGSISRVLAEISTSVSALQGLALPDFAQLKSVNVDSFASISMPMIFLGLFVALLTVVAFFLWLTRKQKVTAGITWDCGTPLTPRMEITATGFSRSIIRVFANVLKPTLQSEIEYIDAEQRYFPKSSSIQFELSDVYQSFFFYKPLSQLLTKISERARQIQSGNMNVYILYIFITLIVALFIIAR